MREGKPYAPRRADEFRLLPGVRDAIRKLKAAGYLVVVVTNQPDIGNGLMPKSELERMHQLLRERAPVDDILVCEHRQDEGCECRKPRPGMLLAAARTWGIDLARSVMVGDRAGDVIAGQVVGCYTVFVDRGYREPAPASADSTVGSLPQAVEKILARLAQEGAPTDERP